MLTINPLREIPETAPPPNSLLSPYYLDRYPILESICMYCYRLWVLEKKSLNAFNCDTSFGKYKLSPCL